MNNCNAIFCRNCKNYFCKKIDNDSILISCKKDSDYFDIDSPSSAEERSCFKNKMFVKKSKQPKLEKKNG